MKSILISSAVLVIVMFTQAGRSQEPRQFPFWISATQVYKFPGTTWSEAPGDVEQVIAEDAANYVVIAPDGTRLQLPKPLAKTINPDEAANQLIVERQKTYAQMVQLRCASLSTVNPTNTAKRISSQPRFQFSSAAWDYRH